VQEAVRHSKRRGRAGRRRKEAAQGAGKQQQHQRGSHGGKDVRTTQWWRPFLDISNGGRFCLSDSSRRRRRSCGACLGRWQVDGEASWALWEGGACGGKHVDAPDGSPEARMLWRKCVPPVLLQNLTVN
jgi:hypothetical protein